MSGGEKEKEAEACSENSTFHSLVYALSDLVRCKDEKRGPLLREDKGILPFLPPILQDSLL